MGTRRQAREAALKILFELEYQNVPHAPLVAHLEDEDRDNPDFQEFLERLVATYRQNQVQIDSHIEERSEHWKLSRMPLIDRNILRLGITELLNFSEIPKSVTINEYLEIAKKYGTEDSSGFVNGILDKIAKPT